MKKLRFSDMAIEKKDNFIELSKLVTEYNEKTKLNDAYPILSSTQSGIYLQDEYFDKQTASNDTTGYKIVPRGYFTYRSMSDTGSFTFNIQNTVEKGIVSPAYPVFFASKVNAKFLYYYLNNSPSFIIQILSSKEGGTRFALSFAKLQKLRINVPSSVEQEKIGGFLGSFDGLIQKQQERISLLRELKQGYLQQMFPVKGSNIPKIRFKGFTEAWEQCELSELATFSKGSGYSKGDLVDNGSPIILYGRLYTKYETTISHVDTYVLQKSGSVISAGGEVIVPASGETAEDIAIASVVEKPGIILGGDLNVVHPKEMIESTFLALSITYGFPHIDMAKRAQGKSVVHLHNSDLKNVILSFPKKEEQLKISQYLMKLDSLITLHQHKLEELEEMKKGYMQRLFA